MQLAVLMPVVKTEPVEMVKKEGVEVEEVRADVSHDPKCPYCDERSCLTASLAEQFFEALGICNHRLKHYLLCHYHPYLQSEL
jgi:hypothetical protein